MKNIIKFIKEQEIDLWVIFIISIPLLVLVLIATFDLPKIVNQIAIFITFYTIGLMGLPMILKKEIKYFGFVVRGRLIPILGYFILITTWGITTYVLLLQFTH